MLDAITKPDWREEFKRLDGAYAPSTLRSYFSCYAAFEDWATARGFMPLPARPSLVAAYIQSTSHDLKPSTLRNRVCAIRKIHLLTGHDDPTYGEIVNRAMRKAHRKMIARPWQAKGITANLLREIIDLQPDSPLGNRNKALLHVGYDILARRSELTALKITDLGFLADGTAKVIVRRSKADPYGRGRSAHISKACAEMLRIWIERRNPNADWLFQPVYRGAVIPRSISCTTVKRLIKNSVKILGVENADDYSSHSLRVGAAQELLRRGLTTSAIMRAGGWKSVDVLARYLEEAQVNVWA